MYAAAAGTALLLSPIALVFLVAMGNEASASTDPAWNCSVTGTPAAGGWTAEGSWDTEQVGNAAIIVEVAVAKKVPPFGWTVGVATAMQESSLRNLDHGDRDSLGLFQQRPSQGGRPRADRRPTVRGREVLRQAAQGQGLAEHAADRRRPGG